MKTEMGEILIALQKYLDDSESICNSAYHNNIGRLLWLYDIYSQDECDKCPFYKEYVGCLFRQGKVPREW